MIYFSLATLISFGKKNSVRVTGGLYCKRTDLTENGCFLSKNGGGLCRERADFCREWAIRFPGVYFGRETDYNTYRFLLSRLPDCHLCPIRGRHFAIPHTARHRSLSSALKITIFLSLEDKFTRKQLSVDFFLQLVRFIFSNS